MDDGTLRSTQPSRTSEQLELLETNRSREISNPLTSPRVDRLFRQSGLIRDKWDDVHYNDGSTYGEKTVERAIANTDDVYEPSSRGEKRAEKNVKEGSTSTAQTVGGTDGARAAYLAEKNQLLSGRVSDLEATLKEKNGRIEELEAENATLREDLADARERADDLGARVDTLEQYERAVENMDELREAVGRMADVLVTDEPL